MHQNESDNHTAQSQLVSNFLADMSHKVVLSNSTIMHVRNQNVMKDKQYLSACI